MPGLDELVAAAVADGSPLDAATVVAQLTAENPRLQALTTLVGSVDGTVDPQALQALLAARDPVVDDAAADVDDDPPPVDTADDLEARDELVEMLERLWAELQGLRDRNRRVADALGACPRCWGERPGCPRCRGRGRPGGRDVDLTEFDLLVAPAAARHERQTGIDVSRIA